MKTKTLALVLSLSLLIFLLSGCGGTEASTATQSPQSTDAVTVSEAPQTEQFSDGDGKNVSSGDVNATVTLSGGEGMLSDTTRGSSGSTVTITAKGVYRVTGSSDGVQIVVNDSTKSGNVYLVLDSASMTNTDACIVVENADKVILQLSGGSSLTSTDPDKGAVYAKDDLTVNGSGSLTVTSAKHGIVCSNDLKITDGVITVNAESIALKAGDSVRIGGGTVTLNAGHDGVQVDSDDGTGWFYMDGGVVTIDALYDGIDVGTSENVEYTGYLQLAGGTLSVIAGGGSDNSRTSTSQKGLKCDGSVYLDGGTVSVSAADDAIHADGDVSVTDGVVTLSSSDDGVHAGATLSVSGGVLTVGKSYEGLEAGTVSVYASDDGVNAAGGSDSASTESGPWTQGDHSGLISISGGELYVNAGGDGLDSNGSIYVSGGTTIVEGPAVSGNGALDKGDGSDCVCSVTGGTVLALGTADMAVNFDSGSQCAALVSLSGSAGDTITVDDGSGFRFTASKSFACVVYTSPSMQQGNSYTITAGSASATADFSSGLYYSDVAAAGGKGGMAPGNR